MEKGRIAIIYKFHSLMMHAVHVLVQPFSVQNSMPPVENKILHNKVKYYLAENYFPASMKPKPNENLPKDIDMIQ